MKSVVIRAFALTLLCLGASSVSACKLGGTSAQSRFYLLTPVEDTAGPDRRDLTVRIGAVEVPKHLDAPEITSRVNGNELQRSEFERWGEPLRENCSRVLALNLAILLETDKVLRFPWEGPGPVDHHVFVAVIRFDSEAGKAVLEARWTVTGPAVREVLATKRSKFEHPIQGDGYADAARAMSAALGDLSQEVADAIKEQSEERN